jgi:cytochrome c
MRKSIGVTTGAIVFALFAVTAAQSAPEPIDVKDDAGNALMGDPTHGEVIFRRCQVCHSIKAGQNMIGPSLHGVVGRTAGTVPGYNYSTANKNSGIVWTEQEIFQYLKAPQATVPGTKMTFPGLPSPQERADVIAFLAENSK